ncbi:hypothetical protein ACG5V6_25965 [Streptomyces chitinivorans]|uniref:Cellulose synthase n=1 Tax=Streptomyces chitinivorans TaxID=1257027 RepID=A0ABW7I0F9_9ACTN|nr:hypothetical protein [Streptomyces chitinivorans]MDH2408808.1 hypothetical protein [Streptomyces chitinivorans]
MLTTTVCAALSAAGLAVAFLTAYRRRFAAATRIAALSLVPVGLAMSGLLGMFGEIGGTVAAWASDLVLKPTVWAGFGVLAAALVLYVVGRAAGRRTRAREGGSGRGARRAAESGASRPALGGEGGRGREGRPAAGATDAADADDFSDIEAILKKHGI